MPTEASERDLWRDVLFSSLVRALFLRLEEYLAEVFGLVGNLIDRLSGCRQSPLMWHIQDE